VRAELVACSCAICRAQGHPLVRRRRWLPAHCYPWAGSLVVAHRGRHCLIRVASCLRVLPPLERIGRRYQFLEQLLELPSLGRVVWLQQRLVRPRRRYVLARERHRFRGRSRCACSLRGRVQHVSLQPFVHHPVDRCALRVRKQVHYREACLWTLGTLLDTESTRLVPVGASFFRWLQQVGVSLLGALRSHGRGPAPGP